MTTQDLIALDWQHCWHPFTPQDEWCAGDPVLLESGDGVWLTDRDGQSYLDGNSSIWTNIHGHRHPRLDAAIQQQLQKVAHTSYLGYAHANAATLAARLCGYFPCGGLSRCFFSDDGSTAVEVAMKMSLQSRMQSSEPAAERRQGFICFANSYHGDTMGAAALGGVSLFFDRFAKLGLPVTRVAQMEELYALPETTLEGVTAVIIEPIMQGVNQMTPWPSGMLAQLRQWTAERGMHLILDEVMTGFGRTGEMFACHHEDVVPDFLCLAKGLTGGYLPMAATLTTEEIYNTFLGPREHAFYYGHSYTANQLGCAVAHASLDILEQEHTLEHIRALGTHLASELQRLQSVSPYVYEVRHRGLVSGIELRQPSGEPFPAVWRVGSKVCERARAHGLLTRPIIDTIVFMPPYCITPAEITYVIDVIALTVSELDKTQHLT